jgi:glucose-6-phosphate 1-epimerase
MANDTHQGLACQRLTLPCGDTVLVALQGAHVLSWVSQGRERLFLSPANTWDGHLAIRGGVPVCFPQFNQRGTLPKHGFARNMKWTVGEAVANGDAAHIDFTLSTNDDTLAIWQQAFVAVLRVAMAPGQLTLTLTVNNTEVENELHFTGALHTYLAVDDIDLTELRGLGGRSEWDAVADVHGLADEALYFDGEFDRVYTCGKAPRQTHCICKTAQARCKLSKARHGPTQWCGTPARANAPHWPTCPPKDLRACCAWKLRRCLTPSRFPLVANGRAGSV